MATLVLTFAATLVAACGSSSSSGSKSGSSNGGGNQSSALSAATALVAQYEKAQAPVEIPKITKPVPTDVRLGVLTCGVPVCLEGSDPIVAAAHKLGWFVYQNQVDGSTQGYIAGWNAILAQNPTAIIYVAYYPADVVSSQIAEARKRNIQLIALSYNAPSLAASGASYAVSGAPELKQSGELMGAKVAADANGPTTALFVQDPVLSNTLTPVKNGFTSVAEPAGVKLQTLDVSISGVGQAVPGQVVSYLQRHPEVKYLVMSLADFGAGVPQALRAVGLDKSVKIISRAPHGGELAQIKSGDQWASVAEEVTAAGYRAVDDVIRLAIGEKVLDPDPAGWHQIMVASNITQTTSAPQTPGVPDAFYKAWGLS